jgi:hypothetical protein
LRYKRDESFRFAFGNPLPAFFSIMEVDQKQVELPEGKAVLMDLSLNGMKLSTPLDIPAEGKTVTLRIRFTLNDTHFTTNGKIVWKEKKLDIYHYGIQSQMEESQQEKLMEEIKVYAHENQA